MFGLRPKIPIPPNPKGSRVPRDFFANLPVEERFLANFEELRILAEDGDYHAAVLSWLANRRRDLRRDLNFAAGLITLISGGAVGAVVTDLLTSTYIKYAAAISTLAGGLCTLSPRISLMTIRLSGYCGVPRNSGQLVLTPPCISRIRISLR